MMTKHNLTREDDGRFHCARCLMYFAAKDTAMQGECAGKPSSDEAGGCTCPCCGESGFHAYLPEMVELLKGDEGFQSMVRQALLDAMVTEALKPGPDDLPERLVDLEVKVGQLTQRILEFAGLESQIMAVARLVDKIIAPGNRLDGIENDMGSCDQRFVDVQNQIAALERRVNGPAVGHARTEPGGVRHVATVIRALWVWLCAPPAGAP